MHLPIDAHIAGVEYERRWAIGLAALSRQSNNGWNHLHVPERFKVDDKEKRLGLFEQALRIEGLLERQEVFASIWNAYIYIVLCLCLYLRFLM